MFFSPEMFVLAKTVQLTRSLNAHLYNKLSKSPELTLFCLLRGRERTGAQKCLTLNLIPSKLAKTCELYSQWV